MEDYGERVAFGVVRNVAVPVVLGTSYIYIFVKGMFSTERKIDLYNSKVVPILYMK